MFSEQKQRTLKRDGILLMILSSFLFAIMGALVKLTTQDLPFMQVVFFRSFVTVLLLTPIMIKNKVPLLGKQKLLLFARGTSGFIALSLTFYVTSQIKLADVSILNRTSTFFVVILAALLLKERVSWKLYIYIVLAFFGCILVIKPGFAVANQAGLLGVLAGFFAGLAYVLVKKLHDTESFYTIVYSFGFLASLYPLLFFAHQFVWPTSFQLLALLGVGLFGTIAQLCMTYSYKYIDASIVNPYSFSTVLFSAFIGFFFWHEIQDIWSILGGIVLIFCGIQITYLKEHSKTIPNNG